MRDWRSISDVVDAPNRSNSKRFTIRAPDGRTKAQIETVGYFDKHSLRGRLPGDMIEVLTDFGILGYDITGEDASGNVLIALKYFYANAVGLVTAVTVPMAPALAAGPAAGAASVQDAVTAINTAVQGLADDQTAAEVPAVAGGAGTTTAGLTTVQAQLSALNGLSFTMPAIIAAVLADPGLVALINSTISSRFSWNGVRLDFDFDNDGSTTS